VTRDHTRLLFLAVHPAPLAAAKMFRALTAGTLVVACIILLAGGFSGISFAAFAFVLLTALLTSWRRFQRSPFSLVTSFTFFVFFTLPLLFLSTKGRGYEYGRGLRLVPGSQSFYEETTIAAILFLGACYGALSCGLAAAARRQRTRARAWTRNILPRLPIGLLAIIVLGLTLRSNATLFETFITGVSEAESLLIFIFFDHAYLILFPVIISMRLTANSGFNPRIAMIEFVVILTSFLAVATLGSSKGFILSLFFFSFLVPLSLLKGDDTAVFPFPKWQIVTGVLLGSILIFAFAHSLRIAQYQGSLHSVSDALTAVRASMAGDGTLAVLDEIAYRVSAPLDRYLLLFSHFVWGDHDKQYAADYGVYTLKHFLNLTLPGTPFAEAYIPTSNLLDQVLVQAPLVGFSTKDELVRSLNTQPFTLPGTGILAFGMFAPAFMFVFALVVSWSYRVTNSVLVRLSLLYCFYVALLSYGVEVAAANSLHVFASLVAFVALMRLARLVGRSDRGSRTFRRAGSFADDIDNLGRHSHTQPAR
jgi:hypothetical protein